MTKKLFFLQFFAILALFVLPPLFAKSQSAGSVDLGKINYYGLISFCAALFLLFQERMESRRQMGESAAADTSGQKLDGSRRLLGLAFQSSAFLTTFGALLLTGTAFMLASDFFGLKESAVLTKPQGAIEWFVCVLTVFFAAFYEETVYRNYLPKCLLAAVLDNPRLGGPLAGWKKAAARLLLEALVMALFALAHRWQGWAAVLNALAAGTILRLCFIKCKSLAPGIAAHFLYNLAALAAAFA